MYCVKWFKYLEIFFFNRDSLFGVGVSCTVKTYLGKMMMMMRNLGRTIKDSFLVRGFDKRISVFLIVSCERIVYIFWSLSGDSAAEDILKGGKAVCISLSSLWWRLPCVWNQTNRDLWSFSSPFSVMLAYILGTSIPIFQFLGLVFFFVEWMLYDNRIYETFCVFLFWLFFFSWLV